MYTWASQRSPWRQSKDLKQDTGLTLTAPPYQVKPKGCTDHLIEEAVTLNRDRYQLQYVLAPFASYGQAEKNYTNIETSSTWPLLGLDCWLQACMQMGQFQPTVSQDSDVGKRCP